MFIDLIGWTGAFLILLGYFLVSSKKTKGDARIYQLINLIGAICLVTNAFAKSAWPLVGLNLVWFLIAVKSLFKL